MGSEMCIRDRDSRSYFTSLLATNNDFLLNDFVENSENVEKMIKRVKRVNWKNGRLRRESLNDDAYNSSEEDINDPEEAFLSISQNLRQAFKKHLPLVSINKLSGTFSMCAFCK